MTYTPERNVLKLPVEERRVLARTTSSPDDLMDLATDEDFWVRYWVAHNTNTPEDAIRTQAKEELRKQLAKEIEEDAIRYYFNPNYKPGPYKTLELTKVQYDALKQLIDSCKNSDLLNIHF